MRFLCVAVRLLLMTKRLNLVASITLLFLASARAIAGDEEQEIRGAFTETVRPFLSTYCESCHGKDRSEAKLDLSVFQSTKNADYRHRAWDSVLSRLEAMEMPPEEAKKQPSPEQRRIVIDSIRRGRKYEAARNAGDPGPVVPRRLSNAEYNYTIRDLTGVNIQPAKEFPVDPANEAGFDNSAESLAMSPALLKKYLGAARQVAEHLVLKPEGIAFAPHPVVTDTDRDKYCVKRIVQFYQRQPTDYADYFFAAWSFQNRTALGKPDATLADFATTKRISPKYLATIWSTLVETKAEVGPLAKLQRMWRELPSDASQLSAARSGCEQMRDFVVRIRKKLEPKFENLDIEGSNKGSQPFVLWKNRQYSAYRRHYNPSVVEEFSKAEPDAELQSLAIPPDEAERSRYEATLEHFCSVFPDAFYISERGRDYVGKSKEQQEKGRLLSAGFHSMMGYFRDDAPLYELVLDSSAQRELDTLWQELDFITAAPLRQYTGFVWFERTDSRFMRDPEFDFARAEDKDVTSEANVKKLSEVYLAKARKNEGSDIELEAIGEYFRTINSQIRWVEQARVESEPSHLESLLAFAARAYRRPLSDDERKDLLGYYRTLRQEQGLTHAEAIEDSVVSILISPFFCYRIDLATTGHEMRPLSDVELASRLSYFLWSSMPDHELLDHAVSGDLHRPEVLTAQTKRMLKDQRIRSFATEFGGNWLDFRRFDEHNSVDRDQFPTFTDDLRQSMFEEPVRFFVDLVQNDRSVLDFLDGDYTFVNPILAKHYGMPDLPPGENEWQRVDAVGKYHRGGLLPMSVFLTKNAPGLRTSPVKRGYWVVRRLLGERIPAPPPNVPELPNDERKLGDLTLREAMARHREHKSCAGCHDRFDSIGLAFENFGPVGEHRDLDLAGRPVDTRAVFPGGNEGNGLNDLRRYLREHRQQEYLDNLCRKMLSYALGRTLQLSDDPLVDELRAKLEANGYRFGLLVESIVTSRQFLHKRGSDQLVQE
jgi:hypothetical protein